MRIRTLTSIVLLLSLALAACGGDEEKPTKGDVFVYVTAPLSGFQANGGQTVLGGARLKAEQLNDAGGLLGYRVVVRGMDDESDNEAAAAVASEIAAAVIRGERVLGVIGHLNSGQTGVGMEVFKDLPLVVITPTSSELSITQRGYTNFFRVNANDAVQADVDAQYLVNPIRGKIQCSVTTIAPAGTGSSP